MKRVLIASLLSLAAAPVLATGSSFNDFPEQGHVDAGRPAPVVIVAPSFNDQADLQGIKDAAASGVAGRAAADVAATQPIAQVPAY